MNKDTYENTLRDYLIPIFRHKALIIITFFVIMVSVFVGLELKTPVYQARVKMLITARKQTTSPYYSDLGVIKSSQQSLTQSEIVYSTPVLERAVRVLKLNKRPFDYEKNYCSSLKAWLIDLRSNSDNLDQETIPQEQLEEYQLRLAIENLAGNISVYPIQDTDLFAITASDFDPKTAARIANVVSRSYIIFDLEQQLAELQLQYGNKNQLVMQLKDNIRHMAENLTGEKMPSIEAIGPASVKIIEQAKIPFQPTGQNKRVTMVIAFFMSTFLGIILAYGFEYIDQTFKSPKDVEQFFNLPLLGSIPKEISKGKKSKNDLKKIILTHPSYHHLSEQIYLLVKDKNIKTLLITAASFLDGSTSVAVNTSIHLSHNDHHKVLLINANLRVPEMNSMFNISSKLGLANVLEGKISFERAIQDVGENLSLLSAGETSLNPMTLLDSHGMQDIINLAKEKFEIVIVDYPNLKNIKDVSCLSSYVDGIILVVNEGKTRRHVLKTLLTPLKQRNSNLIGVVLNNRTYVIPKMIYKRI